MTPEQTGLIAAHKDLAGYHVHMAEAGVTSVFTKDQHLGLAIVHLLEAISIQLEGEASGGTPHAGRSVREIAQAYGIKVEVDPRTGQVRIDLLTRKPTAGGPAATHET